MSTTNILDLNNRIDELEKNSGGGGSADSAKRSDIATEFSTETSYTAGNFVYYEGKLYQFNADHSAGAWDPTDVVEANVTDQIVSNKAVIDGLTASDIAYGDDTVKDALDAVMSRTATGTTAAGLASAIAQLSVEQIANCAININGLYMLRAVRARTEDVFEIFNYLSCHGSPYTIDEYRFDLNDNSFKQYTQGLTTITEITITSWTIYYHGTPIT